MAELNTPCTYGGFSSIVNAALKKNFVPLLRNSSKLGITHYFLDQRKACILLTGHRKSLIYQAAPDIASESAARGLVSGKERAL